MIGRLQLPLEEKGVTFAEPDAASVINMYGEERLTTGGRTQSGSCPLYLVCQTPKTEPMVGVLPWFWWLLQDVVILHQSPHACRESASGLELRSLEVDVHRLGTQVTGTRCFPGRTDSQIP
jgi:hypothetical protein